MKNYLYLNGFEGYSSVHDVKVLSLALGSEVYSVKTLKATEYIDLSGLEKGYYLVNFVVNGMPYQEKIIKE